MPILLCWDELGWGRDLRPHMEEPRVVVGTGAEAEHLKANSLKSKIFEFDMAISSITYVLQFILIDFNDNHTH